MNEPPQIPPMTNSRPAIRYQLTRRDLFANWMTVIFRNRILQVFVLAALALNEFLILAPDFGARAFSQSIFYAVAYLIGFLGFLAVTQCVLALANAFLLKHRGVLGEHVLEITDQGLVERTAFNEALHRWPIGRILSLGGYLYVYVSDNNSHQVPKRCFSPEEIGGFEAELRTRTRRSPTA